LDGLTPESLLFLDDPLGEIFGRSFSLLLLKHHFLLFAVHDRLVSDPEDHIALYKLTLTMLTCHHCVFLDEIQQDGVLLVLVKFKTLHQVLLLHLHTGRI